MSDSISPGAEITSGTLYRRIPNDHAHWVTAEQRPTKYNFTPDGQDQYLSMHRSDVITPEAILGAFPGFSLLEIAVAVLRSFGLRVTWEPKDGPDHAAVWGLTGSVNALRRRLCERGSLVAVWEPGSQRRIWPAV